MTIDPFYELRASRPEPDEHWALSDEGQTIMLRAIERGNPPEPSRRGRALSAKSTLAAFASVVIVGGVTVQAVGVPGLNDEPSKESLIADSDTPLFPADDGAMPNDSQSALAERVTDLLTPTETTLRDVDGVPPQLAQGIVGFTGSPATGYTVIVGKGQDRDTVVTSILNGLPPDSARYLAAGIADHSTAELERVWRAVVAYGRRSSDALNGYTIDIDAKSGRVDVTVGTLTDQVRDALQRIGGDAIQIHVEGPIGRL